MPLPLNCGFNSAFGSKDFGITSEKYHQLYQIFKFNRIFNNCISYKNGEKILR